jgi:16S rRNA (guanine527-N7)-methyltransferase
MNAAEVARRVRELVELRIGRPQNELEQSRLSLPGEFPARIEVFALGLAQWGGRVNLTASPEDPEEVAFHVIDSLMGLPLCDAAVRRGPAAASNGKRILDFGSGGGFPGVILAAARPSVEFVLVEARRKRASFLSIVISKMGLPNAKVQAERLLPAAVKAHFDAITSRASGPLESFLKTADFALRYDGSAILYANPSQSIETNPTAARTLSLVPHGQLFYEVERHGRAVKRLLVTWRKSPV